jgi:hypothetical protein
MLKQGAQAVINKLDKELERDAKWLERQRQKEEFEEWWEAFDDAVKDDPELLRKHLRGEL